jgi:thiol-disulfide isomerase/thioredoxin
MNSRYPAPAGHSSRTLLRLSAAAVVGLTVATLAACGPTTPTASAPPPLPTVAGGAIGDTALPSSSPSASASATASKAPAKPHHPAPKPTAASDQGNGSGGSGAASPGGSNSGSSSSTAGNGGSGSGGTTVPVPADAPQQVTQAFQEARADGKNVLLDFGATWCPACQSVHAMYSESAVKAVIDADYHLVQIDISNSGSSNMSLLEKYDDSGSYGLPVLIVVSPSGVIRTDTNKTGHPRLDESGFIAWLRQWAG